MKVLYIIHGGIPYGSNIALLNLLENLIGKGIEPLVIYSKNGLFCQWLQVRNIKMAKIKFGFCIYPSVHTVADTLLFIPRLVKRSYFNRRALVSLKSVVREFQPDIIHTNLGPIDLGFKISQRLGIPHVWHIREYQTLDFSMRPFPSLSTFRSRLRRSDSVISITQGIFDYFAMGNNATVINDGVLPMDYQRFNENKEKFFLFVGKLRESKGIRILIETFISFSKVNNTHNLLIAGDGDARYVSFLKDIVKEAGINDRIQFLGYREDRLYLMARASALVVPSVFEGFGFITVEAIFNGCLVIGNSSGGTREILKQSEGLGLLFSNSAELLKHLIDVSGKAPHSYFPMIRRAQKVARQKYSIEKSASLVFNEYNRLIMK